jgi:hypothetical protein
MQYLEQGNVNNSQPQSLNAERETATLLAKCHKGNGITRGHRTSNGPDSHEGLLPPVIEATSTPVAGRDIERLWLQNKQRRPALQQHQTHTLAWTSHRGDTVLPPSTPLPDKWRGDMCPSGIATSHPAGELLHEWSRIGCPTRTGRPWTKDEIWEAVKRGPHRSALSDKALEHFAAEAIKKVNAGQSRIVIWDDIKDNPPSQLKIHRLRQYRTNQEVSGPFWTCLSASD